MTCSDLTQDAFLGGRLMLWQPRRGYRAATDPVFLAAAVPARPGDSVLDLGCGVGTAALCLGTRVPGLDLHGVELQADYADLARRNASEAGLPLEVTTGDIAALPPALSGRSFDHVLMNPPFFAEGAVLPPADPGRATAFGEVLPLADWIDAGLRRLKPRGRLAVIHLADRLPEILAALSPRAGAIEVLPLCPRAGRDAGRVIVRARKGVRTPFRLLPGLVIHDGARHEGDGDDFTPLAGAVLRDAAPLDFAG
jgi:tRNA1Val (adenine37-N6)-methyltransferase